MIKTAKKQLYSPFSLRPLRIISQTALFSFLYIFLPFYAAAHLKILSFLSLFIFYLINAFIVLYSLNRNFSEKSRLQLATQDLQEKINILREQNSQGLKNKFSLEEKIARYRNLKKILEEINQNLTLESIAESLATAAFYLIANNKGNCILYLRDNQTQTALRLFKTKKEDKKLVIKHKEGDIFDLWVLRHIQALFIEDAKKDYRFDLDKLEGEGARPVLSLISSPLISNHRLLGILRLDNQLASFYSQDDLRFLTAIGDFGAVALENGQYFEKMQNLATHDALTYLYTKGYFLKRLREEYRRCVRQNAVLSLLMLDIDYFKDYNDKFGHIAGDIVLKTLSIIIVEFFKELNPVISRFGGEEFCVVLNQVDKQKALRLAQELCAKIAQAEIVLRRHKTNVTVSIGVASFPFDARDEDELILKADRAMYEAKRLGRNRVVVC